MREVRLALLEADVNFEVAKDFTRRSRSALGQDVLKSLSPGQQVVKIVHEELTALMGSGDSRLAFGRAPTVILLAGLQGSGKTTAAAARAPPAKEASARRSSPLRPAAPGRDRPARAARPTDPDTRIPARYPGRCRRRPQRSRRSRRDGLDVVILDTAGRLSIDEALMDELQRVRDDGRSPRTSCSCWTR